MRLQTILVLILLSLALPAHLRAEVNAIGEMITVKYDLNEAIVDKLDGTIMVQHPNGLKPTALQTLSTIQKGDILTTYDEGWAILKDHKGDRIGLESGTEVVVDEFYIHGPDRQVRLLLQKGNLLLKISDCGSRQSFFEVNAGSVVTSINDSRCTLDYDAKKDDLQVQYFWGKLSVIDRDSELKLKDQYTEREWIGGKKVPGDPIPVDDIDKVNFNRFFNGEDLLQSQDNNILLGEGTSLPGSSPSAPGTGRQQALDARKAFLQGRDDYNKGLFREAKNWWEQALVILPDYGDAINGLQKLAQEHPELKIDEYELKSGQVAPGKR